MKLDSKKEKEKYTRCNYVNKSQKKYIEGYYMILHKKKKK
jgi:hypothetical protein